MHKYVSLLMFVCFLFGISNANPKGFYLQNDSIQTNDSSKILIYFGGDVTFADHFERYVGNNYEYPFNKLGWFREADISMVNLENPLTDRGSPVEKQFNFRALPDYTKILESGGIDIVTIANNHIYDYSDQGLFDTISYLDSCGIKHIGAGRNLSEARSPVIFNVKGIKIGFLAYYGLRKHSDSNPATSNTAGTALRKLTYIKEDIENLKSRVDLVIINFHWGIEKETYPDDEQINFAHKVIEFGADLIIGHHPHVLQGIELYHGKAIVYSLGNFIFGGNSRKTYQTAILGVEINNHNPQLYHVDIVPIQVDYWQPYKLINSDSTKIIKNIKDYSSIFEHSIF